MTLTRVYFWHRQCVLHGPKNWWERGLFALLLPVSLVFGLVGWLRGKAYDYGLFSHYHARVPVISVGNLAAGGTGKTPAVDWLVKAFLHQGQKPAVVSRGYGGSFTGEVGVVSDGKSLLLSPFEAGDEPYLLARKNPQALIVIARKKAAGVRLAVERYAASVVILDDGFQHRRVARDLDLVLLDATHPLGNGLTLPAGLLREFPSALQRADLLLLTRAQQPVENKVYSKPSWTSCHRLADYAVSLSGEKVPLVQLQGKKLAAFAGIALPSTFFEALTASGLNLQTTLELNDHAKFNRQTLAALDLFSRGCDALLTTEKDAVKLKTKMLKIPCYQVPMTLVIDRERELMAEITTRLWSKDMSLNPELLEILACPKCKQKVLLAEDQLSLSCQTCQLRFPVRDNIPVMLIDEAQAL